MADLYGEKQGLSIILSRCKKNNMAREIRGTAPKYLDRVLEKAERIFSEVP